MTWEQDGKLAFFILTSANLSKAAWGSINKDGSSCMVSKHLFQEVFTLKLSSSPGDELWGWSCLVANHILQGVFHLEAFQGEKAGLPRVSSPLRSPNHSLQGQPETLADGLHDAMRAPFCYQLFVWYLVTLRVVFLQFPPLWSFYKVYFGTLKPFIQLLPELLGLRVTSTWVYPSKKLWFYALSIC